MFTYNDKVNESTSLPSESTTVVKYDKSSCVFCNEWFDSYIFSEHLIHCGQVLEQCPNLCDVFLPRLRIRAHLKECQRGGKTERFVEHGAMDQKRMLVLESDINSLRSVINEEIRQRLHLITDVGSLRKQNQMFNEKFQQIQETLNQYNHMMKQCQTDIQCCSEQIQENKIDFNNHIIDLQDHIDKMSLEVSKHQNFLNDNILTLEETLLNHERCQR